MPVPSSCRAALRRTAVALAGLTVAAGLSSPATAAVGVAPPAVPDATASSTPFIVGGRPAARPYPFMASIQVPTRTGFFHVCGGTLVDPEWVVTARHCVGPDNVQVRLGSLKPYEGGTVVRIRRQVVYPATPGGVGGDIALIRLASRTSVTPARLGAVPRDLPAPVRLVGWGALGLDRPAPRTLMELDTKLQPRDTCDGVGPGDLCVDDPVDRPGSSACFGDSGGPALVLQGGGWRLIGATSRDGMTNGPTCSGSTVYTSVPNFRRWIETTIGHPLG